MHKSNKLYCTYRSLCARLFLGQAQYLPGDSTGCLVPARKQSGTEAPIKNPKLSFKNTLVFHRMDMSCINLLIWLSARKCFLQNFRVINYKLSKIVSGCAGATSNHNTMVYHQQQHHQLCVTAVPESLLYRTSNSMWNLWTSNKERQSPMMLSLAKAVKICKQTRLFTSTDNLCLQLAENWKSNWHLFLDGIWSKHSNILNIKWKILKGWVMNSQVFWGHFGVDTFIM